MSLRWKQVVETASSKSGVGASLQSAQKTLVKAWPGFGVTAFLEPMLPPFLVQEGQKKVAKPTLADPTS